MCVVTQLIAEYSLAVSLCII